MGKKCKKQENEQKKRTLVGVNAKLEGVKCHRCGCKKFDIYKHVFNVGAYCSDCGKYIKFLNNAERKKLNID